MARFVVGLLFLLTTGCSLVSNALSPPPTPTPGAFVARYASPEEIAPVATLAAQNCGKPYFGSWCP